MYTIRKRLRELRLRTWMLKNDGTPASSGAKPSYEELEREVQKLKREVAYITEINRILKKSTTIFSAEETGDLL